MYEPLSGATMGPRLVILSAIVAQASAAVSVTSTANNVVFDNTRMTAMCIIGAIMGAFIGIYLFRMKHPASETLVQQLALKFGVSMLSGVSITPILLGCIGSVLDIHTYSSDTIVGIATLNAVILVFVIFKIEKRRHLHGVVINNYGISNVGDNNISGGQNND